MAHDPETNRINLAWLLRFRSVEILVQAGVIGLVVLGLRVSLPLMPLLGIVLFEVATNVAASAWLKEADRVPDGWLGTLLIADVLLFTGLLGFTGGPYNPFSFLYVIQVALGALVLSPWMAATVAILCAACFAALFEWHVWLPTNGQEVAPHELHHLQSHVQGMAFALAVASGLLVYFVQRVRSALAVRDAELARARDLAQRHERLAALATLSAGAAHELSTPLSTLLLGLCGLPLSRVKPRQSRYAKFGTAIGIYSLYYLVCMSARSLVQQGIVPAFPGLWWAPALLGAAMLAAWLGPAQWRRAALA